MSNIDWILANARATMEMEGFSIPEDLEVLGRECLEGKLSFTETIEDLKKKYMQKPVM